MSEGRPQDVAIRAKVSLNELSPEELSSLKDELLKVIMGRAGGTLRAAYGRHSNVHSSNSNPT